MNGIDITFRKKGANCITAYLIDEKYGKPFLLGSSKRVALIKLEQAMKDRQKAEVDAIGKFRYNMSSERGKIDLLKKMSKEINANLRY